MSDLLANPKVRQNLVLIGLFWLLVLTIAVAQVYKRNRLEKEYLGSL